MTTDQLLHLGHRKRVKEKFLASLGKELHDYELLELLLFSAFARLDTKPIAKKLLAKFGSLSAVINADIDELREIDQIGDTAITVLKTNGEIINRILKNQVKQRPVLANWQAVLNYVQNSISNLNYEVFRVLFLNKNYQLIEDELLGIGENNQVQVSVKLIAKKSLILHASSIILIHNHPAGNIKASNADIKVTNEICVALKPLNIDVLDHLIIGKNEIFSFKQEGLL